MGKHRNSSMALLMTVVIVCMAVFSALTVATAAQDLRLSRQYAAHVREITDCENLGQRWLAQIQMGERPAGTWVDGEKLGITLETEAMTLTITLRQENGGYEILQWSCAAKWNPEPDYNLWH